MPISFFNVKIYKKTGSFKIRGDTNALLNYFDKAREFGVVLIPPVILLKLCPLLQRIRCKGNNHYSA